MLCGCLCPFRSSSSSTRRRRPNHRHKNREAATLDRGVLQPLLSLDEEDTSGETDGDGGGGALNEGNSQYPVLGNRESQGSTSTALTSDLSISRARGLNDIMIPPDVAFGLGMPAQGLLGGEHVDHQFNLDKYQGVPDDELDDLQKLEKHCSLATHAERMRFLNAKGGNYTLALDQLKKYLAWRDNYDLDQLSHLPSSPSRIRDGISSSATLSSDDSFHSCASSDGTMDQIDWKFASDKALAIEYLLKSDGSNSINNRNHQQPLTLPQLARILTVPGSDQHLCDLHGNRILQLLPAQMDPTVASPETFQLCIAFYLERKLSRTSSEKLTVTIDVRGGHGWSNPKPNKLVPFIKSVSKCMEQNFPERLERSVLFPMPRAAAVLWGMIRRFLDPNTANKIKVISGNAGTDAEPPYERMEKFIGRDVLELMEANRVDTFS